MTVPEASRAVNTPTTVPAGALLFTVKLLILMVIQLSDRQWSPLKKEGGARIIILRIRIFVNVDKMYALFGYLGRISRRDADASMTLCGIQAFRPSTENERRP